MKLRELRLGDAELMFEWMKDDSVVHDLQTDFLKMEIDDCKNFISRAKEQYAEKNPLHLHYAITDEMGKDSDEYLGTVSLKNINYVSGQAEFAIAIRQKAMHKGLARLAMEEIIAIGFERLALSTVYWYVSPKNIRANRFYEKNGYQGMNYEEFHLNYEGEHQIATSDREPAKYIWYLCKNTNNPGKIGRKNIMSGSQKKRDKITAAVALFFLAVLAWGLLWFAESNIERAVFCVGIILMLVCVTLFKARGLIYIFILGMSFTACYTCRSLVPVLYYSNSNLDALTANSVWSNPQNKYADRYSADAMMYTIFNKKKCIINSRGYYYDYAKAMFKEVIIDESIPIMLESQNYKEKEEFEKIGVSLVRNHVLLFVDQNIRFNNEAYIFVNPTNLEECTGAVLVNDDLGNIYIMADSEWRNE